MSPIPLSGDIHATVDWRNTLPLLGVNSEFLRNRHGPCPGCGGHDRFRFDDKGGRGSWICSRGGGKPAYGDAFQLLEHVHGWSFVEARRRVLDVIGGDVPSVSRPAQSAPRREGPVQPTRRVRDLLHASASPDTVDNVVAYLTGRCVWPLPHGCHLRAHAAADYWHEGEHVGRYPALVAPVRDAAGELVTAHVTYLQDGRKIGRHPARKILSTMRGRRGCAVRLAEAEGETLGIAEGIETALAACAIHGVPTWAALSAPMLARWASISLEVIKCLR